MTLVQTFHGGSCCGMTHINEFPVLPTTPLNKQEYMTGEQIKARNKEYPTMSLRRNSGFPPQTAVERLQTMIHGIENGVPQDATNIYVYQQARPKGCIEVVLTESQCQHWQQTLLDLDFRVVNTFVNSNTNRTINVFHRNSGAPGVKPVVLPATASTPASTNASPTPTSEGNS